MSSGLVPWVSTRVSSCLRVNWLESRRTESTLRHPIPSTVKEPGVTGSNRDRKNRESRSSVTVVVGRHSSSGRDSVVF